jgi:cytoskeletal protein RodZ
MSTQRLVLLFTLVAVMGGCSIWYMKVILPTTVTTDDMAMVVPAPAPQAAVENEEVKPAVKTTVSNPPAAATQAASAASTVDADIEAIAASVNDTYDDSALEAQITSAEPTLLSNAYGI